MLARISQMRCAFEVCLRSVCGRIRVRFGGSAMHELRRAIRGTTETALEPRPGVFGNRLLDVLPRDEVVRLAPFLRRLFLHRGEDLSVGAHADHVYFPVDALLWAWSKTTDTERPTSLHVVGRGGVMSLAPVLGFATARENVLVISPGSAWRLHRAALDTIADSMRSPLRRVLLHSAYASFAIAACRLACNSEHNVDRRLARWLLWVTDETGKPEVTLTHQQLADLAAIRRPSVSLALADLQRRGIVRVHHGLVQVLDRSRLERESCPCHEAIRRLLDGALT